MSIENKVDAIAKQLDSLSDKKHLRDYQIGVWDDSIHIFDMDRLVGSYSLKYDEDPLGTLIEEDNQ
jgi:hypothetical protein